MEMDMEINSTYTGNPNWLIDYDLMDDLSAVSAAAFHHNPPPRLPPQPSSITIDFSWPSQSINCSSNVCEDIDNSFEDSEGFKEIGSRKRLKSECSNPSGSKACREKLRRDRLNEKFMELSSILEPGRTPKIDKAALLCDAVRTITHLRSEVQKLNQSNENLQCKIKELKAEKNELREEKQRLKADREKLEQQVKSLAAQPGFLSHPSVMGTAFAPKSQPPGNKLMPFIGYPGIAMWQFMQPAIIDTSQDHILHPPVA